MTRESLKEKRLFTGRLHYATFNPVGSPTRVCPATCMAYHQHCAPPYQGSTTEPHCANFTRRTNMLNPKNAHPFGMISIVPSIGRSPNTKKRQ
ncbi:hypothetical protein [Pedobacter endophyticus]|uniref:Uncharacterized protein n=1 Tax=Pedobacter endophyticus TaxID=2789740 RepID=A0A7S9Q014_9SPHI|nr:hypothetical protein [Pedobacter endophyticus]QPH40913.1 hypothetical protein IZT61_06515 [Pedobacter endophyticus]